jgi:hypothetical protein
MGPEPHVQSVLDRFRGVRRTGSGWVALCPSHADKNPSLSISTSDGKILLHCHAGCSVETVCAAVGIEMRELFAGGGSAPRLVAEYDYVDECGVMLFQVVRFEPKGFRQRRPDGRGGWIWNLAGTRRVLYRLPEVIAAKSLLVVEGEKDVETGRKLGFVATCNPCGAGKWREKYSEALVGKIVVIIPDGDGPGRKHARQVVESLRGKAENVRVFELPGAKDLTEWAERGGTRKQLLALIDSVPARERPAAADSAAEETERPKTPTGNETRANCRGGSQATRLVSIAEKAELFHSPDGTAFANVPVGSHRETWQVKSSAFRQFLAREFYLAERAAPNAQAVQAALNVIAARACFDGREETVFVRVAERDGGLWLDLANAKWQAVEVTGCGWRIEDNPPVCFRRAHGMLPLPVPVKGGTVSELSRFLNLPCDGDRALVYSWLIAALRPRGPYPILNLHGEQGTAKSTASKVLRELVDPYKAPLRTAPRDERDLQIAASNSHVIALDNISSLETWLSDALCRLATGGGLATRELYTDSDEIIFDAQRPVLLNGIEDLATRGDFLERCIIVCLPQIPEAARQEESRFWPAFEEARPRILGALLDVVSLALRRVKDLHLERLPRMADFAAWAVAAEPGLGLKSGAFLEAYEKNRKDANSLALEASLVVAPLSALVEARVKWEGTTSDLLHELERHVAEEITKTRSWPKSARALSGTLRRLAPNLRAVGISVSFPPREAGTGRRLIALEKSPGIPSQPSQSPHARQDKESAQPRPSQEPSRPPSEEVEPSQQPSRASDSKERPRDGGDDSDGLLPFSSPDSGEEIAGEEIL